MAHSTENFSLQEFACHCGCGFNIIDQRVIDMAQAIRSDIGKSIRVNSGCRCEKHNKNVGGVSGSFHTKGLAADLSFQGNALDLFLTVHKLWTLGKLPELKYCIWYIRKNFVHIDCGKSRSNIFATVS